MLVVSRKEERQYQAIIHREKLKFSRKNQATRTGEMIRQSCHMDLSTPVSPTTTPVSRAHRYPQAHVCACLQTCMRRECFRTHRLPHTNICVLQNADANTYTFSECKYIHSYVNIDLIFGLIVQKHLAYAAASARTHSTGRSESLAALARMKDIQRGAVDVQDGTGPHSCLTLALDLACFWSLQAAQLLVCFWSLQAVQLYA